MEVVYLLVPVSVVLVFGIAVAFWWSVKSGQFDDLEGPGFKVLMDDDEAAQGRIAESMPEKNKEKVLPVDPGQP
ncbi:MAG: cbb3-type cytochrome oxidase assembly protein CcoS [Azonexus sp.]|jgi:cbb3-type cytochrome oxidase maturation protein|nr:cbb3-type cytochrome oxidase assembly protein CcoS [Azonexus sp.]